MDHCPHDVVERLPAAGPRTDLEVEQHPEQQPFVVVGNRRVGEIRLLHLRRPVVKPGIEARAFRRHQLSPGFGLQLADFLRQPLQELLPAPEARAQQVDVRVVAGHALGKPERARVSLVRVVERPEALRPQALDVPEVEELVRRRLEGFHEPVGRTPADDDIG